MHETHKHITFDMLFDFRLLFSLQNLFRFKVIIHIYMGIQTWCYMTRISAAVHRVYVWGVGIETFTMPKIRKMDPDKANRTSDSAMQYNERGGVKTFDENVNEPTFEDKRRTLGRCILHFWRKASTHAVPHTHTPTHSHVHNFIKTQ